VEIHFQSARLRQTCCALPLLTLTWGEQTGRAIARRLTQLRAGSTLADLRHAPGRYREVPSPDGCTFAVDVCGSLTIIFRPADLSTSDGAERALDWSTVRSITILEITEMRN
jgi:hypothetical protein